MQSLKVALASNSFSICQLFFIAVLMGTSLLF